MPRVKAKAEAPMEPPAFISDTLGLEVAAVSNACIQTKVLNAIEKILLKWPGLDEIEPDGLCGAVFNEQSFTRAMEERKHYECRINLLWCDTTYRAQTGVPIRECSLELMNNDVASAGWMSSRVEIAVPTPDFKPLQHKGKLQRVSPPEVVYALLLRISDDIDRTPDKVDHWKQIIVDFPVVFILMPHGDRWWYEYNSRERVAALYAAVAQTALQRLCGVIAISKSLLGTQDSKAAMVRIFEEKALKVKKDCHSSLPECHSETHDSKAFIQACLDLQAFYIDSEIMKQLQRLDDKMGLKHPLNSIHKLLSIKKACYIRTDADMVKARWVVTAIVTNIIDGNPLMQNFSSQDLMSGRSKCLAHAYVLKYELRDVLLAKASDIWPDTPIPALLRRICTSHATFKATMNDSVSALPADKNLAEQVKTLPGSARQLLTLFSNAIYRHESNTASALQSSAKNRISAGPPASHDLFRDVVLCHESSCIICWDVQEKVSMPLV